MNHVIEYMRENHLPLAKRTSAASSTDVPLTGN